MRRIKSLPYFKLRLLPLALFGVACGGGGGPTTDASGSSSSTQTTDSGDSGSTSSTSTGGGNDTQAGEVPGGVALIGQPVYYSFVRLSHKQWENSVRDIFELPEAPGLSSTFNPDPPDGRFSNNERALYVGSELWNDYQRAAEGLAKTIATDSTLVTKLGGLTNSGGFIDKVGKRAFRRPLTATEKTNYQSLWTKGASFYNSGDDAVDGARVFLEALLQSAHFLYRMELEEVGTRLSGWELATKLSLLLRDTTPSDELLATAASGKLDTDEGLVETATKMLEEDAGRDAVLDFHVQLYGLERYKNIEKSATAFPSYTTDLNQVLYDADTAFFNSIYGDDGGLRDILTSLVAFINAQTAPYYGLRATGPQLKQVTLDESRPGFLTRLGFLAKNATLSQSDPIHRGVDINLRMVCKELSPPSGVIPPLPDPVPGQTNRERVTAHTADGVCAKCHVKIINPAGFAFENFDAMGQVRTMDAGKPIDTADSFALSDGVHDFSDAKELINILAENQQTHSCYAARLAEYLLTRDVAKNEEQIITSAQQSSFTADASTKELVLTMIQSPLFTTAQAGAAQ